MRSALPRSPFTQLKDYLFSTKDNLPYRVRVGGRYFESTSKKGNDLISRLEQVRMEKNVYLRWQNVTVGIGFAGVIVASVVGSLFKDRVAENPVHSVLFATACWAIASYGHKIYQQAAEEVKRLQSREDSIEAQFKCIENTRSVWKENFKEVKQPTEPVREVALVGCDCIV